MTEKLKPCPFCGGRAVEDHWEGFMDESFYKIKCFKCEGQTKEYRKYEQAIEAWNRRVNE